MVCLSFGGSHGRGARWSVVREAAPLAVPVAGATGGSGDRVARPGLRRRWCSSRWSRDVSRGGEGRPVPVRTGPSVVPAGRRAVKDRQPPNAVPSPFVPATGEATHGDPSGGPGRRSARGYPAAVSTSVGADPAVVGPYLAEVLGDERWRSVDIDLIAAGMSNLTYVVTPDGGSPDDAVILRRPPTGAVLATAHDMVREHRVISALGPTAVPVPRTLHLCTDESVLGAPFYVMERVVGIHVVKEFPPGYADEPAQRRAVGERLVDVLADLHTVDVDAVGLSDFGRPEGFAARQVRRWTKQWEATRDRDRPGLDALAARLAETVPPAQRSG